MTTTTAPATAAGRDRRSVTEFLKRYAPVDDEFVDDFFGLVDLNAHDTQSVDLDAVAKWLRVRKGNLLKTLRASYAEGSDYVSRKPDAAPRGRGQGTRRLVLLTPDCFKALCMQSRTPQAARVRDYFIAVEKTLLRYRVEVMDALEQRVQRLVDSNRPLEADTLRTGVIYVISDAEGLTLHKIGRTKDLAKRLRSHGAAIADGVRGRLRFVFKTPHADRVEACVKAALKGVQYRKYKEVYQARLKDIKHAIQGCHELVTLVQTAVSQRANGRNNKHAALTGGAGADDDDDGEAFIVFTRTDLTAGVRE